MTSTPRRLLITLVGNSLIGVFLTALGVGSSLAINILISNCIGFSIFASCSFAGRLIPEGPRRLLGLVVAVPVGVSIGVLLGVSLSGISWHQWEPMGWQAVAIGVTVGVMGSGFFYLRERNLALIAEVQQRENRRLEAEKRGIEAQLKMLQAQIEPHFLFNSLANVSALIAVDTALAARLLDALIRYLRASLSHTRADGGTLNDEMALLGAYLDVLKIRMGERLAYVFDIPPELGGLPLPPMILQPLVENAVRHGLEPKVTGGTLRISARREGGRLLIQVADDGLGFDETPGEGIGLANIRARLAALFGAEGRLSLSSKVGAGVTAIVEIPA